MLRFSHFLFVVFAATVLCTDKDSDAGSNFAIELNANNFKDAIAEKNHFVMFYAPWCGHSRKLFPIWEQLAETFNLRTDPRVVIAKVDCTENHELCVQNVVTGYPTLKFFKPNVEESTKFKGTRDLQTITNFINELLGDGKPSADEESEECNDGEAVHLPIELTEQTFDKHVASGRHFVKFFAPWCTYCRAMEPAWNELAQSIGKDSAVSISQLDCTKHRTICQNFEVKGYPTLLWIENGQKVEKYSGGRSLDDFKAYVNKMVGPFPKQTPKPSQSDSTSVVILSSDNFKKVIEKGVTFVKFYAPWCGHCQKMSPIWEELAIKLIGKQNVKIAKVDCTLPANKELCMNQQVEGFPTLYIYNNGEKVIEYNGNRQLSDMYEFVLRHAAKHDEL